MDVDIPQSEQITQTWNKQKQTLRKAKLRRGERPKDRPPRHVVITEFEFSGLQFRQQQLQAKDVHYVRTTFIPPSYPPCTIPTENLARIHINDLRLETHHRGNCLVLRTITVPHRLTSTMTIVEDENDDVVMISLYHQGGEQKCPASEIIGKGTILIVKEPFLKTNSNGGYGLRVDHLSDVLFLDIEDERVPIKWQPRLVELDRPANQVKEEGNIAFRNKRNWEAIAKYTKALQLRATPDDLITIRRNRAAAYNNTGQYDAALSDTGFPNWDSVKYNEKSLLRAAAALYKLERFTESVETLQTLLSRYPNDEDAKKLLHRAQSRVSEQETGVYDFKKLQQEAKSSRPPHLDCATYIGPIEVGSTQSKGRGLFVTKAVKAGEWLLCEKAFCYAAADKHNTTILMEFETGNTFLGSQADLLTSIVQRLHKNPSLAPKYTGLFSGKYKTPVTESHQADGIVDTFLVERIMSLNVFGCPLSSLQYHAEDIVDRYSAEQKHQSCGIWTVASHINHGCFTNVFRSFIGDMMIIRATRDLAPGTELLFQYITGEPKDLKKRLREHWGFTCDCPMCADERQTSGTTLTKRRKLCDSIDAKFEASTSNHRSVPKEQVVQLLSQVAAAYTRPPNEVPRPSLAHRQIRLAVAYGNEGIHRACIKWVRNGLTSLGFVLTGTDSASSPFSITTWGIVNPYLLEPFMAAREAFINLGEKENFGRADYYAKLVSRIVLGEDDSIGIT